MTIDELTEKNCQLQDRIDQLTDELRRLQNVVGEDDFNIIEDLLSGNGVENE